MVVLAIVNNIILYAVFDVEVDPNVDLDVDPDVYVDGP